MDNLIRHVSREGKQLDMYALTVKGREDQRMDQINHRLCLEGYDAGERAVLLGWCAKHPFQRGAWPFAAEYPGDRRWNLDGCKLLYVASPGLTPTWDMILEHLGRGLDEAVEADAWCRDHGILNGADFIRHWYANVLRYPERRLPMLALYSVEQRIGKSLIHEALALLFDEDGYTFAAKAVKNQSGFNAELHGCVLCALEEFDLSKHADFYDKLKVWITSHRIDITYKGEDTFMADNYCHFVMTTNHRSYIPISKDDERIILWEVTPFEGPEIPNEKLLSDLRKEAPAFLYRLLGLDLADVSGRVTLPVLLTPEKLAAIEGKADRAPLEGDAKSAHDAIVKMPKPFEGTACELSARLGVWDWRPDRDLKSRANSLGRYLAKLKPYLAAAGIALEIQPGRMSRYIVRDAAKQGQAAASAPIEAVPVAANEIDLSTLCSNLSTDRGGDFSHF